MKNLEKLSINTHLLNSQSQKEIFLNNEILLQLIYNLLCITRDYTVGEFSNSLLYQQDNKTKVFDFKVIIFRCLKSSCKYLFNNNKFDLAPVFCKFIFKIFEEIIRFLTIINKSKINLEKSDTTIEDIQLSNFLIAIISFFKSCTNFPIINELIRKNNIEIFRYVIMPFLRTTELEQEYFLMEPDNFVTTLNDFAKAQQTDSIKAKVISLLEKLCRNIERFDLYIVQFYLEILYYVINKSNSETKFEFKFEILGENSIFLPYINELSDEELFEQSLQILSNLSYLIYDKREYTSHFEISIKKINSVLLNLKSDFLKAKLCLFYAYTLDDLFRIDNETVLKEFDDSIDFLFHCLILDNKSVSLNLMV